MLKFVVVERGSLKQLHALSKYAGLERVGGEYRGEINQEKLEQAHEDENLKAADRHKEFPTEHLIIKICGGGVT